MEISVLLITFLYNHKSALLGSSAAAPADEVFDDQGCVKLDSDAQCPLNETLLSFYLYTRETQNQPYQLTSENLKDAPFKPNVPVKVLIHGYTGYKDYAPNPELRAAYFAIGEYNIISLDWNGAAKEPCYFQAASNVKPIGVCTAHFIEDILSQRDEIKREDIHVIGFSLGAHVAGNLGRSLSPKLNRITALDPAWPLFESPIFFGDYSIVKSDAEFIDAVHTNAWEKGKPGPVGDVDFYMNNGIVQPTCTISNTSCSHYHAVLYFAESIGSTVGFWGYNCTSYLQFLSSLCPIDSASQWVLMGEYVDTSSRGGSYFIKTNDSPPYAKGKPDPSETSNMELSTLETRSSNVFMRIDDFNLQTIRSLRSRISVH